MQKNIRKISILTLLLIVCLSTFFGCTNATKQIQSFNDSILNSNSLTLTLTSDIAALSTEAKMDGNKFYFRGLALLNIPAMYMEELENSAILYKKANGGWEKTETTKEEILSQLPLDITKIKDLNSIIDYKKFSFNKKTNKFELKEGNTIDFMGVTVKTFTYAFSETSTVIEFEINLGDIIAGLTTYKTFTLTISDVNSTSITLPSVS